MICIWLSNSYPRKIYISKKTEKSEEKCKEEA